MISFRQKLGMLLLAISLASPMDSSAQSQKDVPPPGTDAEAVEATVRGQSKPAAEVHNLRTLETEWAAAVAANDPDVIGRFFPGKFVFVGASGLLQNRTEHLDDFSSGRLKLRSVEILDTTVNEYRNFAVVSVLADVRGMFGERDISGMYRFMDTFRKQNGRWLAVARQQTPVATTTFALGEKEEQENGLIRHNPDALHPPFGDLYSHGVEIPHGARMLFIAGQAGASRDGDVPDDPGEQLDLAWGNVKAVLDSAGMTVDDLVKVTCYIKAPQYTDAYAASVERHLGDKKPSMTAPIVRQLWSDSWYYEIDAVAAQPGGEARPRPAAETEHKERATDGVPGAPRARSDAPARHRDLQPHAPSGSSELLNAWHSFYTGDSKTEQKTRESDPKQFDPKESAEDAAAALSLPQRKEYAMRAETGFNEPTEISPTTDDNPATQHVLETTLSVEYGENQIGEDRTKLRSYNGKLTGPTLRARPGDSLRVTLQNRLPPSTNPPRANHNSHHDWNATNLHTHGLHVSPAGNSDNVLLHIGPGKDFEYEIHIPEDHPAGTFWYHGHKHGAVAAQVASGMSGALIVEGGLDEIPEIKAAEERVFVFQQIPYYDDDGRLPIGVIEPEFAVSFFGPGAWNNLGRFTTINGQVQPVIEMQPGEVERWRFIDSGFREKLELGIHLAEDEDRRLDFVEVAVDGLPLGKMIRHSRLELWPGYRSDVLVKAPEEPGVYLLVDEQSAADKSLLSQEEPKKYLAKIVVAGDLKDMPLPGSDSLKQMKELRLPSITDDEIDAGRPPQQVTYGIRANPDDPDGGLLFTINNRAYDPKAPRVLRLGDAEEWIATSHNPGVVPLVPHPFHIHTNPFEVTSITDPQGREHLNEGPVWRDTIILRDGWMVKFRTRYRRYIGDFVQHCHILDHEDQGMMELVRVVPE